VAQCCKLCWLNVGSGVGVLLNAAIKAIEKAVKEVDSAVEESKVRKQTMKQVPGFRVQGFWEQQQV
jgi:hypothetical protein